MNLRNQFIQSQIYLRQVKFIFKKDFFQIVSSPTFLLICAVCCILWGFFYIRAFMIFAEGSLNFQSNGNIHYNLFVPLMMHMNLVLLFIIPVLTMRLFAEEKKIKTFDLLMSAPLTAFQIVIGKFMAAYLSVLILILISFIYVAFTSFFTDFNWWLPLLSYLGIALLSMIYVSLGLFASVLTESIMLSVSLGVIFNIFIWFIGQVTDLSNQPIFVSVIDYISITTHLSDFVKGVFSTHSLLFFFIVFVFFTYLIKQILETIRWR